MMLAVNTQYYCDRCGIEMNGSGYHDVEVEFTSYKVSKTNMIGDAPIDKFNINLDLCKKCHENVKGEIKNVSRRGDGKVNKKAGR